MTAPKLSVGAVLIDKRIAIMTMPGEPFVQFQETGGGDVRCPTPSLSARRTPTLIYFPTIRQASLGGYGAASAATQVEPYAGAMMVNHVVAKIYEMLGTLSNAPEDLQKTY